MDRQEWHDRRVRVVDAKCRLAKALGEMAQELELTTAEVLSVLSDTSRAIIDTMLTDERSDTDERIDADEPEAEVVRGGLLDMQVCVPEDWTDEQVLEFAEREHPCGTSSRWQIRRTGHPALMGMPERVKCEDSEDRAGFVHLVLEA